MTIQADRNQTNVPLNVLVDRDGGITGLTVVIRIFNGGDLSEFLDFNDGTFKSAGHTTPTLALTEVSAANAPGLYAVAGGYDLSAITIPVGVNALHVHYDITAGGETGNDVEVIELVERRVTLVDTELSAAHGSGGWEGTENSRPIFGVSYIAAGTLLSLAMHGIRDGVRVTPTAMTLTFRNPDGTTLFSLTEASPGVTLDADDVYRVTLTQALTLGFLYRAELSVTDATGLLGPRVITVGVSS